MTALALLLTILAGGLFLAGRADASGTVTVQVVGKGDVTGPGISCSEVSGSDCSQFYANEPSDCGDPPCPSLPPDVELVAGPDRNGFAFQSFTGCGSTSGRTCTVTVTSAKDVTAHFADAADPVATLTSPLPGALVTQTVSVTASASDNVAVAKVDFYVNGVQRASDSIAPYGQTIDVSAFDSTSVQMGARATDTSGRQGALSAVTIKVDNSPPQLSVSGPDGGVYGPGTTQAWLINASDVVGGLQGVACSMTASAASPSYGACSGGTAGHSVTGLPDGSYLFSVRATDNALHTTTVSRSFVVDATPPETSVTAGPANGAVLATRSVAFGISAGEAGAAVGCRLHRSGTTAPAYAPCTTATSFAATGLDDGSYVFEARATDAVGTSDASPATRTFTVDATAPTVSISKQPQRTVKTRRKKVKVAFGFATNDPGATFRCSLDGRAYAACPASVSFKVKVGKHRLSVVAVDAAGNASATLTATWKVKRVS